MAAVGLADLARYGGRLNEAIGILRKGIEADIQAKNTGAAARKTAVMAQYYLDAGRTKEALSSTDQALLLDGSREDVLFLTGRVYAAARPEKTKELIAKLAEGLTDDSKIYAKLLDAETRLAHGDKKGAVDTLLEVKGSDTWIGHFDLARAYVESGESTAADSEAERCLHRAGEATAVFLDDIPSFSSFVPVYYYHARAEEGMKSPEAKTLFQDFLAINKKADYRSPLIEDARTRLGRLN
jgi:tetratricopeptide (TPR) repeat protein